MGELNLIPYELKDKKNNRLKRIKYGMVTLGVFTLFLIAIAIPRLGLLMLQKQKSALDSEILSGNSVLAENKKITSQIQDINQYVNKVQLLSKQRIIVGSKIKGLGKYLPGDISIRSLGYSSGIINVSGSTKNYDSIGKFVTNLQNSKEYSKAAINNINFDKQQTIYNFSITIDQVWMDDNEKTK